jgi:hypothetical protein
VGVLLAVFVLAPRAHAAVKLCPERFAVPGASGALPYCASGAPSASVRRLLVAVHGTNRNATDYFDYAVESVRGASARDVLVVAPQFLMAGDGAAGVVTWTNDGWKSGDQSTGGGSVSSFAAADALIRRYAAALPALREVVVAGHSAGAQFAVRYAAVTRVDGTLGTPLHYVVANPSSYPYLSSERPVALSGCAGYDTWKYGLNGLNPYAAAVGAAGIRAQFGGRHVTYLLGSEDTDPNDSSLDVSCEGRMQGPHRYARGMAYFDHLQRVYGAGVRATQGVVTVAGVAHDGRKMLTSSEGRSVLFGPLPEPQPQPAPARPAPVLSVQAPIPARRPVRPAQEPDAPSGVASPPAPVTQSRAVRRRKRACLRRAARKATAAARARGRRTCRRRAVREARREAARRRAGAQPPPPRARAPPGRNRVACGTCRSPVPCRTSRSPTSPSCPSSSSALRSWATSPR